LNTNLFPAFQPIVNKSREVIAHEALIRGPMSRTIIEIFEGSSTSDYSRIQRFDSMCKCLAIQAHPFRTPLFINSHPFSLNLLPIPLETFDFPLVIELTEHRLHDRSLLKEVMRLKELGVAFAIDDFGKGYFDLAFIMDLRPEYIKIAKEVVQSINNPQKFQIFRYLAEISQQFGSIVITEGIESEELFELALPYSDAFQGYYFGYPRSISSI